MHHSRTCMFLQAPKGPPESHRRIHLVVVCVGGSFNTPPTHLCGILHIVVWPWLFLLRFLSGCEAEVFYDRECFTGQSVKAWTYFAWDCLSSSDRFRYASHWVSMTPTCRSSFGRSPCLKTYVMSDMGSVLEILWLLWMISFSWWFYIRYSCS